MSFVSANDHPTPPLVRKIRCTTPRAQCAA